VAVLVVSLATAPSAKASDPYRWQVTGGPDNPQWQMYLMDQEGNKVIMGTYTNAERTQIEQEAVSAARQAVGRVRPSYIAQDTWDAGTRVLTRLKTATGTNADLLRGQFLNFGQKIGDFPLLESIGGIAMAAGAFDFGWQIGSFLMKIHFLGLGSDTVAKTYTVTGCVPYSPGTVLGNTSPLTGAAVTQTQAAGGCEVKYNPTTLDPAQTQVATKASDGTAGSCSTSIKGLPADSAQDVIQTTPTFTSGGCSGQILAVGPYLIPLAVTSLGGTGTPNVTTAAPADPGQSAETNGSSDAMENQPGAYGSLFLFADAHGALTDNTGGHTSPQQDGTGANPFVVPYLAPGTTYTAYLAILNAAGITSTPHPLSDTTADTTKGPNEVTTVTPTPGSIVSHGTNLQVYYNPSDLQPSAGDGGSCDATVTPIDFSPFTALNLGNKFPFGIFGWLSAAFGSWATSGSAPVIDLPIVGTVMHIDFSFLDGFMSILRTVMIACLAFGIFWWLAAGSLKLPAGGDS
jgi:hypothetical protein